jgi:hypothetical protein
MPRDPAFSVLSPQFSGDRASLAVRKNVCVCAVKFNPKPKGKVLFNERKTILQTWQMCKKKGQEF